MKKLILPIVIALLAGLGGGSGYAFMRTAPATEPAASDSTHGAQKDTSSVTLHPAVTNTLPADSAAGDSTSHAAHADTLPLTPADSLRAVQKARTEFRAASAPAMTAPPVSAATKPGAAPSTAPATASGTTSAPVAQPVAGAVPSIVSPAALPEQRLAKIFGAMQARDAAKVLEQMTDSDVRTILSMMSDRQAAAILAGFPAARAATITKGATRAPETAR